MSFEFPGPNFRAPLFPDCRRAQSECVARDEHNRVADTMNTSSYAHDTSMETMDTYETYETFATAQLQRKQSCTAVFRASRRLLFPNLLDGHLSSSSSSHSVSSSGSSLDNENDTAFLPWNEHHHQTVVRQRQTALSKEATTCWCRSATCTACRAASPRFVAAHHTPQLHRLEPKWWEKSSIFASSLAEQLDQWIESKVLQECNVDERQFWRDMEEQDEAGHWGDDDAKSSMVPYDEDDDDPRYASF